MTAHRLHMVTATVRDEDGTLLLVPANRVAAIEMFGDPRKDRIILSPDLVSVVRVEPPKYLDNGLVAVHSQPGWVYVLHYRQNHVEAVEALLDELRKHGYQVDS